MGPTVHLIDLENDNPFTLTADEVLRRSSQEWEEHRKWVAKSWIRGFGIPPQERVHESYATIETRLCSIALSLGYYRRAENDPEDPISSICIKMLPFCKLAFQWLNEGSYDYIDAADDLSRDLERQLSRCIDEEQQHEIEAGRGTRLGGRLSKKRTAILGHECVKALAQKDSLKALKRPKSTKYWLALWNRHRIPSQAFRFVLDGMGWLAWLDPCGDKDPDSSKGRIRFATDAQVKAWYVSGKDAGQDPFRNGPSITKKTFQDHVRAYLEEQKKKRIYE